MTFVVEIRSGELLQELTRELKKQGVEHASLTLIGGVDAFTISNMAAGDALKDIVTEYDQPGELTGTGEWRDGRAHVHVTCGIEGDIARAGHLHAATVETYFVNVTVTVVESRATSA
ncbi:PCC domain-containing protein [Glycomyces lechevalierae]|uniref:DNA-binding protein with PD1-like motif n=1 Tax=Glycomyces lechevalierae TaxID=256034 RepID=A0ABU2AI39_9ACTN|nr:DUF296 domain-containing protein [Glycomyces lechevalierae]MDR7336866.1 putative DNA-binding protein with PD1-like motif [Glycomyces lechevalierae]